MIDWPTIDDILRTLALRDYNTRVVVLGVASLGLASGVVGAFVLLRKRALLSDAISHATLPGVAGAFLVMTAMGFEGRSLPILLLGAAVSGTLGALTVLAISRLTRLKEDAALGIVLSVFFGLGACLTSIIQSQPGAQAAGLKSFIFGKTASMLAQDAQILAICAVLIAGACTALFKELGLLCFDPAYAVSRGYPVLLLDVLLTSMVVAVTVIGLQAVGLVLMIALLVIPPAAARFWTDRLFHMVVLSSIIGVTSGWIGAVISALTPGLPSGAVIVVVAGAVFIFSVVFGRRRGLLLRLWTQRQLDRKVARQHLLRALYELSDADEGSPHPVALATLLSERSWTRRALTAQLRAAAADGDVALADGAVRLTPAGLEAAWRVTRNHRLWEIYLITHADIAASHVDRAADQVEHILDGGMIHELEALLDQRYPDLARPKSPHAVRPAGGPA